MTGPQAISDENLVALFRSGEGAAFDELVGRYRQKVYRLIYRFLNNGPRAEELTQETFIRVYRNIQRFDVNLRFSTWIYKIATNLSRNEARDRRRRALVDTVPTDWEEDRTGRVQATPEARPDRRLEQAETGRAVYAAIDSLPAKFREIFVLREIQGLSYEEIAGIIRRPIGTVRSRVNRARERFREAMRPHLEEIEP